MNSPNLFILDVGHGNSAVLHTDEGCAIFDAGLRNKLLDFLREKSIRQIDYVILSHADADHIGGLIALLSDTELHIETVYLNTDSKKASQTFESLLYSLSEAIEDGRVGRVEAHATTNLSTSLSFSNVTVDVIAPDSIIALRGPGAGKFDGSNHSTNSLSVVVRIIFENEQAVLLAGDIDLIGLRRVIKREQILYASYLVFPHHGGLPGNQDLEEFISLIHTYTSCKNSIFSIRKNKDKFPRKEIVKGLLGLDPDIRLITTQQSSVISELENGDNNHLNGVGTLSLTPHDQTIVLTNFS